MALRLLLAVVLAGVTAAVYAPATGFDFVSLDDPLYVSGNDQVRRGLDRQSIEWAFTSALGANWLPLTFLSHMADVELFGLEPGAHHRTNVLLHILAVLSLFAALASMTGRALPSAAVAGLFALHPLHVESVAWITERKDVASALFAFLTIAAYLAYARVGGAARYGLVALLLALGLMSKAMLVTLPCVLLLLDLWPLGRLALEPQGAVAARTRRAGAWLAARGGSERPSTYRTASAGQLVVEKLPLFALAAVASAITYAVQGRDGAMQVGSSLALWERLANAIHSYARYVELLLWPSGLSVQVPHPFLPDAGGTGLSVLDLAGAALLLAGLAVLAVRQGGAIFVGLCWFFGMLLPVIGLVQVGPQGMADRYAYLPAVGFYLALVWPIASWLRGRKTLVRGAALGVSVLGFALLAVQTSRQLTYWRGSIPLFEHAIEVDPNNHEARFSLARTLRSRDRYEEAVEQYRQVLQRQPDSSRAHNGMGASLRELGDLEGALEHLEAALVLDPDLSLARTNRAQVLRDQGDLAGALREQRRAIELAPDALRGRMSLARILRGLEREDEAIAVYREMAERHPRHHRSRWQLAELLAERGDCEEAAVQLRAVLELRPDDRGAHRRLEEIEGLESSGASSGECGR